MTAMKAATQRRNQVSLHWLAALLFAASSCGAVQAASTTVYRCPTADGSLSLSDRPCEGGQRQQVEEPPPGGLSLDVPDLPPLPPRPPKPAPAPDPVQIIFTQPHVEDRYYDDGYYGGYPPGYLPVRPPIRPPDRPPVRPPRPEHPIANPPQRRDERLSEPTNGPLSRRRR